MARSLSDLLMEENAPWNFDGEIDHGSILIGKDEFPDITIESIESHKVTEIVVQLIRVTDSVTKEDCIMRRIVGKLSNDTEIEIGDRVAVPTILVNSAIDISKCNACMERIEPADEYVIYKGNAFHKRCMEDE